MHLFTVIMAASSFGKYARNEVLPDMELGRRLQECREAKKITQAEMAAACGLSKNYISALERGINKCSAQTLITYASKLDMSIDELVGKTNKSDILPELSKSAIINSKRKYCR